MRVWYKNLPKKLLLCLLVVLVGLESLGRWYYVHAKSAFIDVGNDSRPSIVLEPEATHHETKHKSQPWVDQPAVHQFSEQPERQVAKVANQQTDCSKVACLALTFDDGPDKNSTPQILNVLSKHHAVATFFLIGNRAAANPDLVRRINQEGSEIGNHSWAHPLMTKLNGKQIEEQVSKAQQAIVAAGVPAPIIMRPPYGAVNQSVLEHVHMPIVQWNVDPRDWAEKDPNKIAETVDNQAKQGCILLLHDHALTAAALETVVSKLQTRFTLVTAGQIIGVQPTMHGQYYSQYTHR